MRLYIDLRVKFRAFGVTFGTVKQKVPLNVHELIGVIGALLPWDDIYEKLDGKVLFDDRGIYLKLVAE